MELSLSLFRQVRFNIYALIQKDRTKKKKNDKEHARYFYVHTIK